MTSPENADGSAGAEKSQEEKPDFPVLDCGPSMANSIGQFNHKDSTIATPIEDIDQFVEDISNFRDKELFDDNLETMSWVVMTLIDNACIKFSGVFSSKEEAKARCKEVSLDLFNTYVLPFGQWVSLPVGSQVEDVAREFAKTYNERIDEVKRRLQRSKEDKNFDSYEDFSKGEQAEASEASEASEKPDPAIVTKMQRAIQRGDATKHRIDGQKFVVVAHASVNSSTGLLRVCHYGDDMSQVENTARQLYDTDVTQKRVDYLVAQMNQFKPWPPNFLTGVERTIVPHNPSQQRMYEASMMQHSDEYQNSLKEIEDFHNQNDKMPNNVEGACSSSSVSAS